MELLDYPSQDDIDDADSSMAMSLLSQLPLSLNKKTFEGLFQGASPDEMSLLKQLLVFNPKKRITAFRALKHAYVRELASPEDELVCDHAIQISMNDNEKFSISDYRDQLYNLINHRNKEQRNL